MIFVLYISLVDKDENVNLSTRGWVGPKLCPRSINSISG